MVISTTPGGNAAVSSGSTGAGSTLALILGMIDLRSNQGASDVVFYFFSGVRIVKVQHIWLITTDHVDRP